MQVKHLLRASWVDYYSGGVPVAVEELRAALTDCLAKGSLRVIDAASRERIIDRLQAGAIIGPIYGLPNIGDVDFPDDYAQFPPTTRQRASHVPFAFTDVVHSRVERFYATLRAAQADIESLHDWPGRSASEPKPIGPWRPTWWLECNEGFRVEVEEFAMYGGRCGNEDYCCSNLLPYERGDQPRLNRVLASRKLTAEESCLLNALGTDPRIHTGQTYVPPAVEHGGNFFGIQVTLAKFSAALESCIRKGWATEATANHRRSIEACLNRDQLFCPLPKQSLVKFHNGCAILTLAGRDVLLAAMHDYFGPDWANCLKVERELYREEHRYCAEMDGIRAAMADYPSNGHVLLNAHVEKIGPWCVYWWKQYPSGYRLEIEMGKPE